MTRTRSDRAKIAFVFFALAAACGPAPIEQPLPKVVPAPREPPPPAPRADGRLPDLARPTQYTLAFDIDPRKERFSGKVSIAVDVPASTHHVVLHAHNLHVTEARATSNEANVVAHLSARPGNGQKAPEELVLTFARPLTTGAWTLSLAWDAPFDDELSGIYRVKEGDAWYAFSQFEAADARRAFPCFDEPAHKTPFDVSVAVPSSMIAVANAPEASHQTDGDNTTFRFAPTEPLPTYLVALAVGELDIRELPRTRAPKIRLVTTKGNTALGTAALDATAALTDDLGDWFGIPYPFAKLDIVAVPAFASGAMENAGLITFRKELLLLDPAHASVRARRSQAMVIAHELAHQWFGDLVTAAWWDDLWLNEGMATWMESRIVDKWQPTWGVELDALVSRLGVMDTDALVSARAVRQPVTSTSEAEEAFDGITYTKGAAVLSTIEGWIGENAFHTGIKNYLSENAGKSVHADRLLGALDRASGRNVSEMAAKFLDQAGVPEVSAQLTCERGSRWNVELSQTAWRPHGSQASPDAPVAWTIPVCVRAQGQKGATCTDLAAGAPSLVAGRGCPAYIFPNAETSYYRFALEDPAYLKLAAAHADLDTRARITLLSNAWAGVRSGKNSPDMMLKVLAAFDDDNSRHVTDQVAGILSGMSYFLVEDDARPAFRKFVAARLAKKKKALGFVPRKTETKASDDALLRRTVLSAMGDLAEDETTRLEAEEQAARWVTDATSIDEDVAAIAVDLASRRAGRARLTELRSIVQNAKRDEDRILALRAMAGFDDGAVLREALDVIERHRPWIEDRLRYAARQIVER